MSLGARRPRETHVTSEDTFPYDAGADLELLLHSAVILHKQRRVSETCREILNVVRERVRCERIAMFLVTRGQITLVGGYNLSSASNVGDTSFSPGSPLAKRLMEGLPVSNTDSDFAILDGVGATMAFPCMDPDGQLIAVLAPSAPKTAPALTEDAIDFVIELCPLAGSALQNARAHRQAEKRALEKSLGDVAQILDATRGFYEASDLASLFTSILDQAIVAAHGEKGSLMLLDDDGLLAVRVVTGLPDKHVEERINRGEISCARFARGQGIAGKVLDTGTAIRVNDVEKSKGFAKQKTSHVRSILCLPIRIDDTVIGVINITNYKGEGGFKQEHERLTTQLADQAAVAISRTRLFETVIIDANTGLYVKPFVEHRLDEEVRRASRYGNLKLSLVCCQIDQLEAMRARFGDPMAEEVIGAVGDILRDELRENLDLAGYVGKGRFHLVLPETRAEGASVVVDRFKEACKALVIEDDDLGETHQVSLSIAIGEVHDGESAFRLTRRVERALDEGMLWNPKGNTVIDAEES